MMYRLSALLCVATSAAENVLDMVDAEGADGDMQRARKGSHRNVPGQFKGDNGRIVAYNR